jgi:Trypsin
MHDARSLTTARLLCACALALKMLGCSADAAPEHLHAGASASRIIGGAPASFAAIGHVFPRSDPYNFCTATLVAPDLVLTAKHCVYVNEDSSQPRLIDADRVAFTLANTSDSSQWTDAVDVSDLYVAPAQAGPTNGDFFFIDSSDTALYRLSRPITNVTPVRVAATLPGAANPHFLAAGFGRVAHDGTDATSLNSGPLTFRMNGGSQLRARFATFQDFVSAVERINPGYTTPNLGDLRNVYEHEILQADYQMLFDGAGDVQVCRGDSGSPLLQKDATGTFHVYGDVSGSKSFGNVICELGSVYSTFGPDTIVFLRSYGIVDEASTTSADAGAPDAESNPNAPPVAGERDAGASGAGATPGDGRAANEASPTGATTAASGCAIAAPPRAITGASWSSFAALALLVRRRRRGPFARGRS